MKRLNQQHIAATILTLKAVIAVVSIPLLLLGGIWAIYILAAGLSLSLLILIAFLGLVGILLIQFLRIAGGGLNPTASRWTWILSIALHLPFTLTLLKSQFYNKPQIVKHADYNFYMFLAIGIFFFLVTLLSILALFISFRPQATR